MTQPEPEVIVDFPHQKRPPQNTNQSFVAYNGTIPRYGLNPEKGRPNGPHFPPSKKERKKI